MSKVRILFLEADEADAESVGAIVNVVREMQSGRTITSSTVEQLAAPLREVEPAAFDSSPPPALTTRRPRKTRAKKTDIKSLVAPKCGKCGQPGHNARSCKA